MVSVRASRKSAARRPKQKERTVCTLKPVCLKYRSTRKPYSPSVPLRPFSLSLAWTAGRPRLRCMLTQHAACINAAQRRGRRTTWARSSAEGACTPPGNSPADAPAPPPASSSSSSASSSDSSSPAAAAAGAPASGSPCAVSSTSFLWVFSSAASSAPVHARMNGRSCSSAEALPRRRDGGGPGFAATASGLAAAAPPPGPAGACCDGSPAEGASCAGDGDADVPTPPGSPPGAPASAGASAAPGGAASAALDCLRFRGARSPRMAAAQGWGALTRPAPTGKVRRPGPNTRSGPLSDLPGARAARTPGKTRTVSVFAGRGKAPPHEVP